MLSLEVNAKGMVMQGPEWELLEATLQSLVPSPRGSTACLAACQGKKGQGEPQVMTSDIKGKGS